MALNEIDAIISGDIQALHSYIAKNEQLFEFPELNCNDKRGNVWASIFRGLNDNSLSSYHKICLSAIRILSRDKTNLNDLITEERFETLLRLAGLDESKLLEAINQRSEFDILLEALKSLCNIVFNSKVAQLLCSKNNAVDSIIKRLRISRELDIPHDIKFFDMKLLFLITALNQETRPHLKNELHGLTYLTESIDSILRDATGQFDNNSDTCMEGQTSLSDQQVVLLCETLKTLFNIAVKGHEILVDEEDEAHYNRLVNVLHDLLITQTTSAQKKLELHEHIVNLLTCVPHSCYEELIPKIVHGQEVDKDLEYEGRNMEAVFQLLQFLKVKLETEPGVRSQQDLLSPILTALNQAIRHARIIRKYTRLYVLPPLKDVHKRPEEGNTLRNYLCRLLTTPITHVRDLVAEFLFVLCKENVGRMIKYTGYGNAAGLFAHRGLMDGRTVENPQFSSESEDSDTEIYKEFSHGINPVVGCYEKPKPNPAAHMSDEQKEYEAMQLVNLMDKLARSGVMQPCRINEDGRPEAIEHVLQLQEDLPRQQIRKSIDED